MMYYFELKGFHHRTVNFNVVEDHMIYCDLIIPLMIVIDEILRTSTKHFDSFSNYNDDNAKWFVTLKIQLITF